MSLGAYKFKLDQLKLTMKAITVILPLVMTLALITTVQAGFTSTYLPRIDNRETLTVVPGEVYEYQIKPQNQETEPLFIKVVVSDINSTVQSLESEHDCEKGDKTIECEVPPGTAAGAFVITMKIKVPRNTEPGTKFPITYSYLTTTNKTETGMVVFNPIGYTVTFNVMTRAPDVAENSSFEIKWWMYAIVGGLVVSILAVVIIRKIRKKKMYEFAF